MIDSLNVLSPPHPRLGRYEINGEHYVRVTTILGAVAKPGLEEWRRRVGIDEANRISRESATFGTRVHKLCEQVDLNIKADCPGDLRPSLTAYLDWKAKNIRRVVDVERTVHHPRRRYAGTLDRVFEMVDGSRAIVDLKTGKTADGLAKLQLCAYADCLTLAEEPVDRRIVVHLPSNQPGVVRAYEFVDPADFRAWRALVAFYHWWESGRNAQFWKETRA